MTITTLPNWRPFPAGLMHPARVHCNPRESLDPPLDAPLVAILYCCDLLLRPALIAGGDHHHVLTNCRRATTPPTACKPPRASMTAVSTKVAMRETSARFYTDTSAGLVSHDVVPARPCGAKIGRTRAELPSNARMSSQPTGRRAVPSPCPTSDARKRELPGVHGCQDHPPDEPDCSVHAAPGRGGGAFFGRGRGLLSSCWHPSGGGLTAGLAAFSLTIMLGGGGLTGSWDRCDSGGRCATGGPPP